MPLRVGIVTAAHLHVWSYIHGFRKHPETELVGVWDHDEARGKEFAAKTELPFVDDLDALLNQVDAVAIVSENKRHAELTAKAAAKGKHVLCEKPLVTNEDEAKIMMEAVERSGIKLMTAFPCRYSPAFQRLIDRVKAGEIGKIRAICATNRGRCPFGWFVEPEKSGGGAMIDHVVHVTDLLRVLLQEEPARVQAQIGNNVYGNEWDDTAMVTIEFPSGIFATLVSSWSRPATYKTWGDVTMNVVGENGVIELDMFGPAVDVYSLEGTTHTNAGYGSDLDAMLVEDFIRCVIDDTPSPIDLHAGLQAARVAIAGYQSVRAAQPVAI